jgi:hypothetical protein
MARPMVPHLVSQDKAVHVPKALAYRGKSYGRCATKHGGEMGISIDYIIIQNIIYIYIIIIIYIIFIIYIYTHNPTPLIVNSEL